MGLMGTNLQITPSAAAELGRQAAVAGTPGQMSIDLLPGDCERHVIRLRPGAMGGVPVARGDGITLHAPATQTAELSGLRLDYRSDLSGGGFLICADNGIRSCACGSAFSRF